jgi:hypothetical protein
VSAEEGGGNGRGRCGEGEGIEGKTLSITWIDQLYKGVLLNPKQS